MVAVNQDTGKIDWDDKLPSTPYGAATVTNNVVFTTTYNGYLYAFNAATGAILLKTPLSAGTNAPVTIDGDYVIAGAGRATQERAGADHRLQARRQGQAPRHRALIQDPGRHQAGRTPRSRSAPWPRWPSGQWLAQRSPARHPAARRRAQCPPLTRCPVADRLARRPTPAIPMTAHPEPRPVRAQPAPNWRICTLRPANFRARRAAASRQGGETSSAVTENPALPVTSTVSYSWPPAGSRFRWPPTLERLDVAVGDHCIADRNAVGELVTPEYDGLPVPP